MALTRGDGWLSLEALGFRGFFAMGFVGGVGVARGVSWGDRMELISIMTACSSNVGLQGVIRDVRNSPTARLN